MGSNCNITSNWSWIIIIAIIVIFGFGNNQSFWGANGNCSCGNGCEY